MQSSVANGPNGPASIEAVHDRTSVAQETVNVGVGIADAENSAGSKNAENEVFKDEIKSDSDGWETPTIRDHQPQPSATAFSHLFRNIPRLGYGTNHP